MEQQFKMIPADCTATHAIVKYNNEVFAEVPMKFALPCKQYVVIMAAIDQVFNSFDPELVKEMGKEGLGGLMVAMSGAMNEEECDKFVVESQMMQHFTVDLSYKI